MEEMRSDFGKRNNRDQGSILSRTKLPTQLTICKMILVQPSIRA